MMRFSLHRDHVTQRVSALAVALLLTLFGPFLALTSTGAAYAAPSSPKAWFVSSGVDTSNHSIQGMVFLPGEIWIHQGDSILWTANSGEIHTVTFVPPGQTALPSFPCAFTPTARTKFDNVHFDTCTVPPAPVQLVTSGFLSTLPPDPTGPPTVPNFSLTFTARGSFTYYCIVHHAPVTTIPGMQGVVHVLAPGVALPYTQKDYDTLGHKQGANLIAQGLQLYQQTERLATNTAVIAGVGTDKIDIMRFIRAHVTIHKGQTIRFPNHSMHEPHTVTFDPFPQGVDPTLPIGNPHDFRGQPLSSGIYFSGGPAFAVTFNKAGTFSYFCSLHDNLGMSGTVTVLP